MYLRSLYFYLSNTELNLSRGIVLRIMLTAVNISIGSSNLDLSNFFQRPE
jgi:hypothetical protein